MKKPDGYSSNLSVKVTPDFAAKLRQTAAQRGLEISVVLRHMLGAQTVPGSGSSPRQSTKSTSVKLKRRARRRKQLAAPRGSDPVVVRLLASVANGLRHTAESIGRNDALVATADVANWLLVLQTMDDRLAQLIEHEERKNAH